RYVDQKLRTFRFRLGRIEGRLKEVRAVIAKATNEQNAVIPDRSIPASEKYLLLAHYDNVINENTARENQLEADQISADDFLTLALQVERADVLEPARVHRTAAPTRPPSV